MSGIVHRLGGGERYAMGASEIVIKATGEHTDGAFFFAEVVLEPGLPVLRSTFTSACTRLSMCSRAS